MELSDETRREIADLLDSGMDCFYHLPTATIEYHPDLNDPNFDPEFWTDAIERIEKYGDKYIRFEKMDSNESFRVMENFTNSLTDPNFRDRLYLALSKPRPFRNFKNLMNSSDLRKEWFNFKQKAYLDFVGRQTGLKK